MLCVLWRLPFEAFCGLHCNITTHDLLQNTPVPRRCLLACAWLLSLLSISATVQTQIMPGMDASSLAPFVNRDLLGKYVQRRVRLAGHVESMDDSFITVKASDDGMVTVKLRGPSSFDDKCVRIH